ncbi:MAG TPA: FAD:protein FMN transferase, partial [Acidimicrobiales bacterium]
PVARVAPVAGWKVVEVDRHRSTIRVPAGVALDLGATAKAWAADQASAAAADAAGCGVLVSLGGDVAVAGPVPGRGWPVRVAEAHDAPAEAPGQTVNLTSGGLATSSTTVRRWQRAGVEQHHLVDPATGRAAAGYWRTVTVAAGSCADANVAATAAIIRGEGAPRWLEQLGLPARLVRRDGQLAHAAAWPAEVPA